jgi:hypothetical protein
MGIDYDSDNIPETIDLSEKLWAPLSDSENPSAGLRWI